ncbi:hypothetical protein DFH28DRAFT_939894 [Melampsora americana]|nr:hypothetical protein DFH28DRAFT_939894 [Melampsora americana]
MTHHSQGGDGSRSTQVTRRPRIVAQKSCRHQRETYAQGNKAAQGIQMLETKVHPKTYAAPIQTWVQGLTKGPRSCDTKGYGAPKEKTEDRSQRRGQVNTDAKIFRREYNVGPKTKQGQCERRAQGSTGAKCTEGPRWSRCEVYIGPKSMYGSNEVGQECTEARREQKGPKGTWDKGIVGPKYMQAQQIWSAKVNDKCTPKYMRKSQRIRRAQMTTGAKITVVWLRSTAGKPECDIQEKGPTQRRSKYVSYSRGPNNGGAKNTFGPSTSREKLGTGQLRTKEDRRQRRAQGHAVPSNTQVMQPSQVKINPSNWQDAKSRRAQGKLGVKGTVGPKKGKAKVRYIKRKQRAKGPVDVTVVGGKCGLLS